MNNTTTNNTTNHNHTVTATRQPTHNINGNTTYNDMSHSTT